MPSAYIEISDKLFGDVISTAFDGGSVGWCASAIVKEGVIDNTDTLPWYAQPNFWANDFLIEVTDCEEGEVTKVDRGHFRTNFKKFVAAYPSSVARIKEEQYDAIDADRLWQFIVFGELVYG